MGQVRQNPIRRTVRTAHLSVLMTVHNFQYTIQRRTVLIISDPLLPPDNHHSSHVVYRRRWPDCVGRTGPGWAVRRVGVMPRFLECSNGRLVSMNSDNGFAQWRRSLGLASIMPNKQQSCLPLSVSSNNAVAISGSGCTDLRRDGQTALAGMEQNICQNSPWLICGNRTVVDST